MFNEKHQFFHGTTRIPTKLGNNMVNVEVGPLHSVVLPEEKRKIIGDTFMKVSDNIMKKLNLDPETTLLAQGEYFNIRNLFAWKLETFRFWNYL